MTDTIIIIVDKELNDFVDTQIERGGYKTKREVVEDGLRLLQAKHNQSKLKT